MFDWILNKPLTIDRLHWLLPKLKLEVLPYSLTFNKIGEKQLKNTKYLTLNEGALQGSIPVNIMKDFKYIYHRLKLQ